MCSGDTLHYRLLQSVEAATPVCWTMGKMPHKKTSWNIVRGTHCAGSGSTGLIVPSVSLSDFMGFFMDFVPICMCETKIISQEDW